MSQMDDMLRKALEGEERITVTADAGSGAHVIRGQLQAFDEESILIGRGPDGVDLIVVERKFVVTMIRER